MQRILLYLVLITTYTSCVNQTPVKEDSQQTSTRMHNTSLLDTGILSKAYDQFRETSISTRRFTHKDIEPLLYRAAATPAFKLHKLGESAQGRNIFQVEYGSGKKRVLLWSQMHGDESTATMALLDLFNFFAATNDDFDSIRTLIRENTHLYFIPMLNPDGAEVFQRRNAMGIDINQDARRGTTPEARILINAGRNISPDFGFNLHDQQPYYAAGYSNKPATISFLAPAYNYERDTNNIRSDAMKLIVGMNRLLQQYIPGGVAKYNDAHEPRGFGDNFQKKGTRTVLIESGGYKNDPEKQYIRRLNFYIILNALIDIATDNYVNYSALDYADIPENRTKINDLVIRNILYSKDSLSYKTDLAINQYPTTLDSGKYYVSGKIEDVGDLIETYGYTELDAEGLTYQEGKVYETPFSDLSEVTEEAAINLLRKGYYAVRVKELPETRIYNLPISVLKAGSNPGGGVHIGMPANFFLSRNSSLVYAVINGYLIDLISPSENTYYQYVR